MRKVLALVLVTAFVFVVFAAKEAECRRLPNLYKKLSDMHVVKVYVDDIQDSTGESKADLKHLKDTLENALSSRMTLNFEVVPRKEDADIGIYTDIVEYFWTDNDPIDMVGGVGGIVYDVVTKSDYARMQAVIEVMDEKHNRALWKEQIQATISDFEMTPGKSMSEEESVTMANDKLVKIFMRDCFSKNHSKRNHTNVIP